MSHVALIGDSIFDNKAYTDGGPDVITHLREQLPDGWQATLQAIDGATIAAVYEQLDRVPEDASHVVLSVGGNDALLHIGIIDRPARSASEVFAELAEIAATFKAEYRTLLDTLLSRFDTVLVCTVYHPPLYDDRTRFLIGPALAVFNNVIVEAAVSAGVSIIDLRQVCTEENDFANEIEPSMTGGSKIA